MLFTLTREDDGWDIAVQKAILCFIGTLVYRPIDEREHPDQPVLASSVMPQYHSGLVSSESPQMICDQQLFASTKVSTPPSPSPAVKVSPVLLTIGASHPVVGTEAPVSEIPRRHPMQT